MSEQTDVVVIGGGPAGSTTASFLARKGWDVTVFERAVFPRDHVGESMLPFCYWVFKDLGVLELMEERFVRKPGVRFLDTDDVTSTTYCFGHKIHDPSHLSFQVLRAEFDELLLDHSVEEGATVHQGTAVRSVDVEGPDGRVLVEVEGPDGARRTVQARFVVDASGRDTFLANRMKTKTAHKELERTALSSHWKGCTYSGGLEEGMIQIVYTGGEKQGWIWCIPLAADRLSVGVVMNTSYYLAQRRALKEEGVDTWHQALYERELATSPFVQGVLAGAEQLWDVAYNGDYSYTCNVKYGDRFALVGDASAFIDPIFSSGVYLAMQSGRYLADAVDERLRDGSEAGARALGAVYERIVGAYSLVDSLIRLFYTPDVINFAQMGSAEAAFDESEHYRNIMSLQHFLLAGDFFEQSHRYAGIVEDVRDQKRFAQYKNLVIDRASFQAAGSCDIPHDVAFNPRLAEHEARRLAQGI